MSEQHRCPFCGSDGIRVNGIRNVLGNPVRVHGWCGACTSAGPILGTEAEALAAFCHPAGTVPADLLRRVEADLAAARAEIERLKEAQRAYEHEVMTGRNEQHARLTSEIERLRTELSKCQWHGAIDEAQADAATYLRERDEARAEIERLKAKYEAPDNYGCHLDLEPGKEPDACVLDAGEPYKCRYGEKVLAAGGKQTCEEWRPIVGKVDWRAESEKLADRIRELEARPPIDRERLVEAVRRSWHSQEGSDLWCLAMPTTIAAFADAILRHLGQPAEAPTPAGDCPECMLPAPHHTEVCSHYRDPEAAGEVCRWTRLDNGFWASHCPLGGVVRPEAATGDCPGCGRRVEVK